jgi:uncharacterized alpha/beta hydrolase family protein
MKFSDNHNNKLSCIIFTTYRKWDKDKEKYYRSKIGQCETVYLKGSSLHARHVIKSVRKTRLKDEPIELLQVDTGADDPLKFFEDHFKIKPTDPVLIMTVKKEEKIKEEKESDKKEEDPIITIEEMEGREEFPL